MGIDEKDVDRRRELFRQDRERHPETRELWKEWEQRRTVREHEVLAYPTLTLRRHADLRPDDTSPPVEPLTVGFGALGDAVALWPGSNEGGEGVVSRHGSDGRWNDRTPLSSRSPRGHVQPLPDGEVLFVDARCRRDEHNAAVYDESGRVLRTAHLGDGIEHVLTTAAGAVWTAYFDEGVFAMRGLSTHGLVRFGSDLSPQWRYPQARQTDLPVISDCYALNVAGEAAWTCAYVDFHLVNVDDARAVDHGPAPVSGASGLLVEGARAALIGASAGGRGVVTPVHLTDDGLRPAGPPRRLVLPDGAPVPTLQFARFTCRGPELHVAIGATWYRFDLDDVPTG
ncbi:hypothetical protein AB1207_17820 [Kineococcus endophyticus]|uniref:Uncharacterized protein n=1 Tax=Kineococcus endophyticus TaxID=1181883 RepID=A0ABV3PAH9_9ACTN